jgi:membrane-associated protease RseP (regulator of RpoE activity)
MSILNENNKEKLSKKSFFILFVISLTLVLSPSLFAKKKKKVKGNIVAPTGFLGNFYPTWPKQATEIRISNIEKGSPSDGSGLKAGDAIVGIGEKKFSKHPLWEMAGAIDEAEAPGKQLTLLLKSGKTVVLNLPKIGAFSHTAPYNCNKTDTIIEQAVKVMLNDGLRGGITKTNLLALMATGEKEHLEIVKKNNS